MKVAIHSGRFHADDVFAVATLKLAGLLTELVRTRDETILATCDLRVDVGRKYSPENGNFDHHQPGGAGKRANGVPYASFGLVWRQYGTEVAGVIEAAAMIDEQLVQQIDAEDVGYDLFDARLPTVKQYTIGKLISNFNPSWKTDPTPADMDKRFNDAVDFALPVLIKEITVASELLTARGLTREAIKKANNAPILVLRQYFPTKQTLILEAPSVLYVVSPVWPTVRDQWSVGAVPIRQDSFELRKPLPELWAGKLGSDLVAATGVDDAVFCHGSRFLAIAESKAGALKLAKLAVED